jgi:hypothetical protein
VKDKSISYDHFSEVKAKNRSPERFFVFLSWGAVLSSVLFRLPGEGRDPGLRKSL